MRTARRGSVIVVVLVTLALAAIMLVKFMEGSQVEIALATRAADRDRLRSDAYAALETALAVMAEIKAIDGRLHAPAQGWGDPYAYAGEAPREGLTVEFEFHDESGKASLPNLRFEELVELCVTLGLPEADACRFADGLFVWTRSDYTAVEIDSDPTNYERAVLPHETPKRSLRSWDELRAVRLARDYVYDENGELTPFGVALRANVSLHGFAASNVNALPPALGLTRGWDEARVAAVNGYAQGSSARPAGAPPWFRSTEELGSILGGAANTSGLGAEALLVRVVVTVREGAGRFSLEAWVTSDTEAALPTAAEPVTSSATPAANGAATGNSQTTGNTANNANASSGGTGARASGQTSGRTGQGATNGSTAAGGGNTSGATTQSLDYPFTILQIVETSGPAPVVPTVVESEDPESTL